ncbi:MAG: Bug family tripartite tricarboxylate transporter substrate binding protein, partial [Burkholderiales bacterium]
VALGIATSRRSSALPELPTIEESGVKGYDVSAWYGVIGPPKMAKPLLAKINGELNRILKIPEVSQTMSQQGADPLGSTPEAFAKAIATDIPKWKKLVADAGIKPGQ